MTMNMDEITNLRLKLLANGFTPLPSLDKRCMLTGWPSVEVTPDEIGHWARRNRRFKATGLRIENGLAVIDIDVDAGEEIADEIAGVIDTVVPELSQTALVRFGKGFKEAWFVRTDESFSRIHSRRWVSPGQPLDAGTHSVECFGGLAPRQFGAFGAHTVGEDGEVQIAYDWDGPSPADTPKSELPLLTKGQLFSIVDAIEGVLERRGFTPVLKSQKGENDAIRAYDLTEDMSFDLNTGERVSLQRLRELALADHEGLRCSASFLEGPSAVNRTRCIVGTSRAGNLTIWESASGVTHLEASKKPRDFALDLDRVAEKLKELEARTRNVIKSGDRAIVAAAKLLETHAFCPNQQLGVVPIWATSLEAGIALSSFRTWMLPHCDEEVGPRGGRVVINPVDIWSGDKKRVTVAGLRMRPDMARPLYEDKDGRWVNIYSPPLHSDEEGSPDVGIEFMEQLIPEEAERRWFLQWLAHKYLRPDIPGPAVLMVARDYGTGRGTLGVLIGKLFGERYVKNIPFSIFAGRSYQSQYTDWGASTLVAVVSESSESGSGSMFTAKRDTYEHLKEMIEPRPVEKLFVAKGTRSFTAPSFTSYIIATNNADALQIPGSDRRIAVLSNGGARELEFWTRVNAWMDDPRNIGAFATWLSGIDLSDYSPFLAPLHTDAKDDMVELSGSDLDRGYDFAMAALISTVYTSQQIVVAMQEARRVYNLDYPDQWQAVAKRMAAKRGYRVGVRDGVNWHLQFDGARHAIYATSRDVARRWKAYEGLRGEVLKNGPAGGGTHAGAASNVVSMMSRMKKPRGED